MIFLANRSNLQLRRLHRERITNRFESDSVFSDVRFCRASIRSPGKYRVVTKVDARLLLDDASYPTSQARIEVGFDHVGTAGQDQYWINWIEPDRSLLVGWHQDETHPEFGEVHLQISHENTTVEHLPAEFIDSHPLDVLSRRLNQLPRTVEAVQWQDDQPIGFNFE